MNAETKTIGRPIFFGLLLANVAFFAWQQQAGPSGEHEPARMAAQIDADKLTIVTPTPVPAAPAPVAAPASEPAPAVVTNEAAPVSAEICRAYAGIGGAQAKALQGELAQRAPALKVILPLSKEATYWVFIPPQPNKAAAEKKVGELKQMGIEDSFIMQDEGPQQYAISLGLFRSEELAANYLASLVKKGARSARMAPREKADKSDRGDEEKVKIEIVGAAALVRGVEKEHRTLSALNGSDCKAP